VPSLRLEKSWPTLVALLAVVLCVVRLAVRDGREASSPPPAESLPRAELRLLVQAQPPCVRQVDAGPCSPMNVAAPLAGANVRLIAERGRDYFPYAEALTDAAGGARIEAPSGAYYCLVEALGRARVAQRIRLGEGGLEQRVVLDVALPLDVRVRDESNRPIAGATVLVQGSDELPHGALTGADGLASFVHVGRDLESVRVTARGFDGAIVQPAARDVSVTLSVPAELAVTVLDPAGAPVSGADVWLAGFDLWPPRQVRTEENGVAKLTGLSRGTYDLRARRGDLVSPSLVGVSVERGERAEAKLSLQPGRFVSVLVSAEGAEPQPIVSADVVLAEDGLTPFPLQGRTDSEGRVTLGPIPERPATLSVRADGFMPESGVPLGREAQGETRVSLVRGGRLTGEVVDAEGSPVEGARLEIVGNDWRGRPIARHSGSAGVPRGFFERSYGPPLPLVPMGELGVMAGPLPLPGMPAVGAAPTGSWQSDLDGNFQIDEVPPGRVRVLVRHPDFVESSSAAVTLEPGGEQRVRVALARGAALEGRLVDGLGRPVEGARVVAIAPHGTQERSAITLGDGSFAFGGVAAEVDLLVARPEQRYRFVLRRSFELTLGESRAIELTLPPERPKLTVYVEDDEDKPLEGARLLLLSLDPSVPLRQTAYSDTSGETGFEDAAGLRATLRVQAPGFSAFEAEIDGAPERVEVALQRGVLVTGRITQLRGRQPLEGAEVVLVQDGERRVARTDAEGTYTFTDVTPGAVRLVMSHPEFAARTLQQTVQATGRADRSFELPAVELQPAGSVAGVVLDAAGAPVPNARVGIGVVPAFLPAGAAPEQYARTGPDGRFTLQGVPAGRTKISAYAVGSGRGERVVAVEAGETSADVELRLRGGESDAESAALANVAITLGERDRKARGEVVIVDVAASSEAERAGLREGDVLLRIDGTPVFDMADARHRLGGSDGSDVILQLGRTGTELSLRVRREPVRR
jgi:protocatechuate 3,4-dioxygenase beta subunit